MRYQIYIICFLIVNGLFANNFTIKDIPIQESGRIKPLHTFAQNQLLAVYQKREFQDTLLSSTDWLINHLVNPKKGEALPIFKIRNPAIISNLGLIDNQKHLFSFNEVSLALYKERDYITAILNKEDEQLTSSEKQYKNLHNNIIRISELWYNFKIIPPDTDNIDTPWLSPMPIILGMNPIILNEAQNNLLNHFREILSSRLDEDETQLNIALNNYQNELTKSFSHLCEIDNLKRERWYNETNLFYISVAFYIISFLLLLISFLIDKYLIYRTSYLSLIIGLIVHVYGIYNRIMIMQRPPISTLYETVIFVGFIGVLYGIILEYYRRNNLGLLIGCLMGIIFHYISFGYAADGETLYMLVAVLNSNFWLATHVTTINIGYGASLVAGIIAHIYLIYFVFNPKGHNKLKELNNNLHGATLFALFFTLFGTILGGIWADQSWGRFWGWDPKENGALLICMWHTFMLHSRITGLVKPFGFAMGMTLINIIVMLSWFGVNLLNVGLHSYGFTTGVAMNLLIFIIIELCFIISIYCWIKIKHIHPKK